MRRIPLRVLNPATRAHNLNIPNGKDAFNTRTVLMCQCPFKRDGDDLHVLVRMAVKSIPAFDDVVIKYTKCTKMNFFAIVPVAEAKGMVAVEPAKIDVTPFRSRMKDIGHRILICRKSTFCRVIRPVLVKYNNKIIVAFAGQDGHIVLLHQFQHGKKKENGMEPALAEIENLLKRQGLLPARNGENMFPALLHGIVVADNCMNGSVLALLDAEHQPFEGFHQLEQGDGLDLGPFARFLANVCHFFLEIASSDHQVADSFHFSERGGGFLISFVFQEFIDQFLAGIDLIALLVELFARQQHAGLDAHQGRNKKDKFAGQFDVEVFLRMDKGQKILNDPVYGDIVDIQFIPFDKEEQEIERALKLR